MDNSYEFIDIRSLTRRNSPWVQKIFGDVSKKSAAQQIAIGGVSGWCTGYLFIRFGKLAAGSLGTTLLLIQIAQHQGYIKINYREVQADIERTRGRITREANRHCPGLIENFKKFVQKNLFLAGGFAGGFLIGIAI